MGVFRDTTGTAAVARLRVLRDLPGDEKSISLKATYRLTSRAVVVDRAVPADYPYKPYRKDTTYAVYTRREKFIETDLPEIVEQAKQIKGQRRSAVKIAREAYDWVLDRTEYKLLDHVSGAGYCLREGHGECGEYSALFVALCRAAGVPARPVTGFWADKTDSWHVWAEFMLPTGEWISIDCSIGDKSEKKREYYFGGLDNRRVALCKTFDVALPKAQAGQKNVDFLQVGCWWWRASQVDTPPSAKFTAGGRLLPDVGRKRGARGGRRRSVRNGEGAR